MNKIEGKYNYEEIDQFVFDYQKGNKDAASELIKIFKPYMRKYIKIIKDAYIDIKDKDSRKFIRLFITDEEAKRKLLKVYHSSGTRSKAQKAAERINILFKDVSTEEIEQELSMILLKVSKRFKKKHKHVNFCGYLYNVFRFEVYRYVVKITSDPLTHRADINLSYNDDYNLDPSNCVENDPKIYIKEPMMILDEELGNNWIRGLTCGDDFIEITPLQRLILKMKYEDGIPDTDISDKLGMNRNTIRRQRNKAIQIIKKTRDDRNGKKENN